MRASWNERKGIESEKVASAGLSLMERTGIEPVTSGLQNRESGETADGDQERHAAQTRIPPGSAATYLEATRSAMQPSADRDGVEMASEFRQH
jgi:hypothetical protein